MRLAKWWDDVTKADVWFCACINCGGYVDRRIIENRRNPHHRERLDGGS